MTTLPNHSKTLNVLIGASLMLNVTYLSIKLYQMARDRQKKKCSCQEQEG